jgi:hypothetical protein
LLVRFLDRRDDCRGKFAVQCEGHHTAADLLGANVGTTTTQEGSMRDPAVIARGRAPDFGAVTASLPTSWLRKGSSAALRTISPEFAVVCLFSLLGLTLTVAALSYFSNETISIMFSSIN